MPYLDAPSGCCSFVQFIIASRWIIWMQLCAFAFYFLTCIYIQVDLLMKWLKYIFLKIWRENSIFAIFAKKCDLTKKCVLWFWRKNGYYGFGENMHFLRENAFFRFWREHAFLRFGGKCVFSSFDVKIYFFCFGGKCIFWF